MTIQQVSRTSEICLPCKDNTQAGVILCVPSNIVAPRECPTTSVTEETDYPYSFIEATIVRATSLGSCGSCMYNYVFQYDDVQLIEGAQLSASQVLGFFCRDCSTQWVEDLVGTDVYLEEVEGETFLVTQHGCRYSLAASSQSLLLVEDTDSVDLTITGSFPQTLSAEVIVSPDDGNSITIQPNGLYSAANILTVTDSNSIDLTISGSIPQDITASSRFAPLTGNQISTTADGLYVPAMLVSDSTSIDLTINTSAPQTLSAAAIVSGTSGNQLAITGSGLYSSPLSVTDTASINLTIDTSNPQTLSGDILISAEEGNAVVIEPDGLYVSVTGVAPGTITANLLAPSASRTSLILSGYANVATGSAIGQTIYADPSLGSGINLYLPKAFEVTHVSVTLPGGVTVTAGSLDFVFVRGGPGGGTFPVGSLTTGQTRAVYTLSPVITADETNSSISMYYDKTTFSISMTAIMQVFIWGNFTE